MARARPHAEEDGTVGVFGPRAVLAYAKTHGVDTKALAAELGIDEVLRDSEGRIPLRIQRRLLDLAAARSHDPAFGLHAAEAASVGSFEAFDYAMWASATLRDVFDRITRFYRVIGDDLALQLSVTGKWASFHRVVIHDTRQRVEAMFAFIVVRARELVGRSFRLHEVRFVHRAPRDARPHRAVFRCPVRFGCAAPELVFAADQLALPVKTSKPGLAIVLDRHLRDLIGRLPHRGSLYSRVHQAIARTLHEGRPSLAATARAIHASPRTLQRYLREAGVTHRQIVDEVRRDMAERLLASHRVSVGEIAFLLGFEDVSGFRRAYRKWTGTSPSGVRGKR